MLPLRKWVFCKVPIHVMRVANVFPSYSVLKIMALTLETSVEYLTGKTNIDAPCDYVVGTTDTRMRYIFESYNRFSDDDKERLFQYTKKICAQTQIS